MVNSAKTLIAFCLLTGAAGVSAAPAFVPAQSHLWAGIGAYELRHTQRPAVQLEYRSGHVWKAVQPMAGLLLHGDGGGYAYGGIYRNVPLQSDWTLTPSIAAGLYHAGEGRDLGGPLEFQSGLELSRGLGAGARMGVALRHLSNASIYRKNPGTETLMLFYSQPFGK